MHSTGPCTAISGAHCSKSVWVAGKNTVLKGCNHKLTTCMHLPNEIVWGHDMMLDTQGTAAAAGEGFQGLAEQHPGARGAAAVQLRPCRYGAVQPHTVRVTLSAGLFGWLTPRQSQQSGWTASFCSWCCHQPQGRLLAALAMVLHHTGMERTSSKSHSNKGALRWCHDAPSSGWDSGY